MCTCLHRHTMFINVIPSVRCDITLLYFGSSSSPSSLTLCDLLLLCVNVSVDGKHHVFVCCFVQLQQRQEVVRLKTETRLQQREASRSEPNIRQRRRGNTTSEHFQPAEQKNLQLHVFQNLQAKKIIMSTCKVIEKSQIYGNTVN